MKKIQNPAVAAVMQSYPAAQRRKLLRIRELIFETAKRTDGVGSLEETLKWGEPSYLTSESGSGTTIRLAWTAKAPDQCAVHFHCRTSLISTFREMFPDTLRFEGNRSIVLGPDDEVPIGPLSSCIELALTYHRDKRTLR